MSVTFSIYPSKSEVPTFREVVELTTKKLNGFLKDYEIDFEAEINITRFSKKDETEQKIDLDSPAEWDNESEYIWFKVSSFRGGIDVYYWKLDEEDKSDSMEELLGQVGYSDHFKDKRDEREELVKSCFENKRQWYVNRWAGQLWITRVAFGFIASSFAELTSGIIYSSDGGWDYQIFPATAEELDTVYFRPEKAISEDTRKDIEDFVQKILFEINNL